MSLMSPNGYFLNIFSRIQLLASTGVTFQPELQVLTTSTKEVPFCKRVFWNAFLRAFLVFLTAPGVSAL